ncbi:unnamed protein product [Parnassius mnemosyne]|uniref:Endonuclease/exonuclease/phosphatase domain-containing protein n=1 Tax=Parnassius mnemosyne TaxID=213953 RepID=A0AAV1LK41_9NEOP
MDNTTTARIKHRSIAVVFFNAHGLKNQINEVWTFLTDHQIDILLVQETFLKPSLRDPKIANYRLIRNDRIGNRLGGTLIYYRSSLHVVPIDTPQLTELEASVCRVAMTGQQPITVAFVYLSPNKKIIKSDFEAQFNLSNSVILGGGLNSKHQVWSNNLRKNAKGDHLVKLSDYLNYIIARSSI